MIDVLASTFRQFRSDLSSEAIENFKNQPHTNRLLLKRIAEKNDLSIEGFKFEIDLIEWLKLCGYKVIENDESIETNRGFDATIFIDDIEIKIEIKLVSKNSLTIRKHCRTRCRSDDGINIWILIWEKTDSNNVISLGAIRGDNIVDIIRPSKFADLSKRGDLDKYGYYTKLDTPYFSKMLHKF